MKTCLYAGSFDPISHGHQFIVEQALSMFDRVIICVGTNSEKNTMFSIDERVNLIKKIYANNDKIIVTSSKDTFLANFCRDYKVDINVRGIRSVKDYEYELQLQYINNSINKNLKTIYLIPPSEYAGLSSSVIKSMVGLNEWKIAIKLFAEPCVIQALDIKYWELKIRRIIDETLKNNAFCNMDFYYLLEKALQKVMYNYTNNRYYHDLKHIYEMLELNKKINTNSAERMKMFWATLYHDIVYIPNCSDNELASAELFESDVKKDNVIKQMILATKKHEKNNNERINEFVDMDMAILAAESERFIEYERYISEEYSSIDRNKYVKRRIDFMKNLLNSDEIFHSATFKNLEEKARTNIKELINILEKEEE
jgi:pantetheine-phosphate adenylyltransferase